MTPADMWAWAPSAVLRLGGFVVATLVPMLCVGWGITAIRKESS